MSSPLATAIQDGKPWLDRFTRREYEKAFRAYVDTYGATSHKQIEEAGEALSALAEAILDELEENRKHARFWNRGSLSFDQQQMVIKYCVPMLLEQGDEAFVNCFHEAWCRRWPKERFQTATYEQLRKGFVNVIMGIMIPDKD